MKKDSAEPAAGGVSSEQREAAIGQLRAMILDTLNAENLTAFRLAGYLWEDAQKAMPGGPGAGWDSVELRLDLLTGRLSANCATYPNQFGASREANVALTPEMLSEILERMGSSSCLQYMRTQQDWNSVINGALAEKIEALKAAKLQEQARQAERDRLAYAVRIPNRFHRRGPKMAFACIHLERRQKYATAAVHLRTGGTGQYELEYTRRSLVSPEEYAAKRCLTAAEAVWLEEQVDRALSNPDSTTWTSLPGGDSMTVKIEKKGRPVLQESGKPLKKYSDLEDLLRHLVKYGSLTEKEAHAAVQAGLRREEGKNSWAE